MNLLDVHNRLSTLHFYRWLSGDKLFKVDYTADDKGYRPVLTVKTAPSADLSEQDKQPAMTIEDALAELVPVVLSDPIEQPLPQEPQKQKPEEDQPVQQQEEQVVVLQPVEPEPEEDDHHPADLIIDNDSEAVIVEAAADPVDDASMPPRPVDQEKSSQLVNAAFQTYMDQLAKQTMPMEQQFDDADLYQLLKQTIESDDPEVSSSVRKVLEEELEKLQNGHQDDELDDDDDDDEDDEMHHFEDYLRKVLEFDQGQSSVGLPLDDEEIQPPSDVTLTPEQIAYLYSALAAADDSQGVPNVNSYPEGYLRQLFEYQQKQMEAEQYYNYYNQLYKYSPLHYYYQQQQQPYRSQQINPYSSFRYNPSLQYAGYNPYY